MEKMRKQYCKKIKVLEVSTLVFIRISDDPGEESLNIGSLFCLGIFSMNVCIIQKYYLSAKAKLPGPCLLVYLPTPPVAGAIIAVREKSCFLLPFSIMTKNVFSNFEAIKKERSSS